MSQCTDTRREATIEHVHVCILFATHVFADQMVDTTGVDMCAHACACGAWWYDVEQMDRAERQSA
jgi:hypothetical protein